MWHSNAVRHRKISLVARFETGIAKVTTEVFKKTCRRSFKSRRQHTQQQDLCPYLNAIKPNLACRCNKPEHLGNCKQQLMPEYSCRKFFTEGKSRKDQSEYYPVSISQIQHKNEDRNLSFGFQPGVEDLGINILNR